VFYAISVSLEFKFYTDIAKHCG